MSDVPLGLLFGLLAVLIVLSAFFSGSETGLMTLNRYRLRHLARAGHPGARRAARLLERPDRLIGVILLGNNFVNILASSVATVIALRLLGEAGVAVAAGLLTLVILIFAEVAPKTLAALYPERLAFPAAFVLAPLLRLLYPLVWATNGVANALLRLLRVDVGTAGEQPLTREELRTVLIEAGGMIPRRHQAMLLSILDLERLSVEDIMVPRGEITGLDIDEPWESVVEQLTQAAHTRLPVYHGSIERIVGFLHLRDVVHLLAAGELDRERLLAAVREPYFVPEGTPLMTQLLNFQRERRRIGLVVDEYGEILGLVTLEDILEEVVGEFTTDPSVRGRGIRREPDGSFLVDGGVPVRAINRALGIELPTDGPRTLNGLILEHMETIPEPGTSMLIAGYPVEIVQTAENSVKLARIQPRRPRRGRRREGGDGG